MDGQEVGRSDRLAGEWADALAGCWAKHSGWGVRIAGAQVGK